MPGSIASSNRSSRNNYRAVGHQATVEEHLFGGGRNGPESGVEVAITGKDSVIVRKKIGATKVRKADAAVISATDLYALQGRAANVSKKEDVEARKRAEQEKAEREEKSKVRKAKMEQMEEGRKKAARASEFDVEIEAKKTSVREKAKAKLDEDKDAVKEMNQMMLYGKVVTVRDAQLQERRMIQDELAQEEMHLDHLMELDRLSALKMHEEREKVREDGQRKGAMVIIDQIKYRQVQRMRDEEARDQERQYILKQIEAIKGEEVEQQKQKALASKKLMEEVAIANDASMKIKDSKMIADKLEDVRIMKYQKRKEMREREIEQEKRDEKAKKEADVDRLRGMQEKAADKQAEMDALRAKRANEGAERAAREKEALEKSRMDARNAELVIARKLQQQEKERRLAEQAKFERDEFERIIEVQMQQEDAERSKQEEEQKLRNNHCQELMQQIAAREEKALQERRNQLEEGNINRAEMASERRRLEGIKARKLAEMQKQGVPEKYCSELARKKIAV